MKYHYNKLEILENDNFDILFTIPKLPQTAMSRSTFLFHAYLEMNVNPTVTHPCHPAQAHSQAHSQAHPQAHPQAVLWLLVTLY